MKFSKKAQFEIASKTLYWGISSIILALLALGLVITTINFRGHLLSTPEKLESSILSSRFLNSPQCFAYQDPVTQRIYPRLIDLSRFTDKTINNCYVSNTTKDHNFQLLLRNLETDQEQTIQTSEWYNVPAYTIPEPVLIKNEKTTNKGLLLIYVQRPI